MPPSSTSHPRRIMRLPEVKSLTGFGRAWIYILMQQGKFPKSRRIGTRAVGWDSQEVEQWVVQRLEAKA